MDLFKIFIYALLITLTSIIWVPLLVVTGAGGAGVYQLLHLITGNTVVACLGSGLFGAAEVFVMFRYLIPLMGRKPGQFKDMYGFYVGFALGSPLASLVAQLYVLPHYANSLAAPLVAFAVAAFVTGFVPFLVTALLERLGLPTQLPPRRDR